MVHRLRPQRHGHHRKSGTFIQIDHVDAPDPLTCVVHLKRADPFLLWNLSDGALGIVPAGSGKDFWRHPIGTGTYKFVSQQQDKDVILERNENSWQPKPSIQRLRFNVVPDDTTRALELQKGSADAEINALEPDTIQALRSNRDLVIQSSPGTIVNYINLNLRDPYLKDVRVRQAVAMAINRPLILDTIWRGQARLADDLLPPATGPAPTMSRTTPTIPQRPTHCSMPPAIAAVPMASASLCR